MTMDIDTLATALGDMLGSGWAVTASFHQIIAVTPLGDRIAITPLVYGGDDVRWALIPHKRRVAGSVIAEITDTALPAEVAGALRSLSYQHHALPAAT